MMKNSDATILYIDDNQNNLEVFSFLLKRKGFTCITASSGIEGIKQANIIKPGLIFLGIQMPEMDGFVVLNHLRHTMNLVNVPAIALTASTSPEFHQSCVDAGFNDCLSKPVLWFELYKLLGKYLPATTA